MVGETAETDAFIWAQARDTAPLTLRVLGPNQFAAEFVDVPTVVHGLCVVFHAIGLAPGTLYSYSIESQNGSTPSYKLRPAPLKTARRIRIAFGSCFLEYMDGSIFNSIVNEKSDLFLMCGDNCYYQKPELTKPRKIRCLGLAIYERSFR
jgi:alkaline phosphatase D